MRESTLESKLRNYALLRGVQTYKFTSPGAKGVPDRIFLGPKGMIFMELKQKGKKPTELQKYHISRINNCGCPHVLAVAVDNLDEGMDYIDTLVPEDD